MGMYKIKDNEGTAVDSVGIRERIKEVRKFYGLTQEEFARRLFLRHSVVCRMELGVAPVVVQNVKLMCHIFGVSENWFRTGQWDMLNTMITDANAFRVKLLDIFDSLSSRGKPLLLGYADKILADEHDIMRSDSNVEIESETLMEYPPMKVTC
jgi:transcriptional regulator with XRE-family HTH domain